MAFEYGQRGRKLSYQALKGMENTEVLVHDLEFDAYDQICVVHLVYAPGFRAYGRGSKSQMPAISEIYLENDEYLFIYSAGGNCKNGEFECYSVLK